MLLDTLKEFDDVENAAEELAGNWKNWRAFVWFGEKEIKNPQNVMIAYTTGPQSTTVDDANAIVITEKLKPFLGNMKTTDATAEEFSSSYHGDRNSLKGFLIRVLDDDAEITPVFKMLFELSRGYYDHQPLDKQVLNGVTRKVLQDTLPYDIEELLKKRYKGVEYSDALLNDVIEWLLEDDIIWEDMDDDMYKKALKDIVPKYRKKKKNAT